MEYELIEELRSLPKHAPEQMCDGEGKDPLERAADAIETLLTERDAAVEDLRGLCWCCAHGVRWDGAPIWSNATTCEHMRKMGTLARSGGKCRCAYWQWRGPQKGGGGNG